MNTGAEKREEEASSPARQWVWPLDVSRYDQAPTLSQKELKAVAAFLQRPRDRAVVVAEACRQGTLARLLDPLRDALAVTNGEERHGGPKSQDSLRAKIR